MRSSRAFGICLHGIGPAVNDVLAYVPVHDVVTLVTYALSRHHPFESDSRSKMLQVFQGYIFGENPPGDTKHIYPPVPPPVFCTRHKHGHATNLHILETAKIETGTLGKECWGTQRL